MTANRPNHHAWCDQERRDAVSNPRHYIAEASSVIDVIDACVIGCHPRRRSALEMPCNTIWRWKEINGIEDL